MSNPSTPFPWKGDARRAGVGRRRKRAKPTSGATRHLLPEEGGRSGKKPSTPFRCKGDARRAGVGRRRKRAKPTSGAMRHFLPEEGEAAKTYLLSFYRKECFATGMPMITNRPRVSKSMRMRSRELRNQMTPEEKQLWYHFLRTYRPRVTRQYVLGPYIADFYCAKAGLIIEIDGKQHCTESGFAHDTVRTHFFENYGLKVVRLTNFQIHFQFNECCQYLETILRERIMERATMDE